MNSSCFLDDRYARGLELNYGPHLPLKRSIKILDIGCGNGRLLAYLEAKGYRNFVGVDIDEQTLSQVPEELRSRTLHVSDLSAYLKEHIDEFDLVLAKDVLYYFQKHEIMERMREIAQAMRPGGTVVAEVFNGALLTAQYTAAKDLGIQMLFTEQSIRALLLGAGLDVKGVFGQLQPKTKGLRRVSYDLAVAIWRMFIKLAYLLERGADPNNPRILEKSILAVAKRTA